MRLILTLCLTISATSFAESPRYLKWTSKSGTTIEAAFGGMSGDHVVLLVPKRVPLDQLNEASQRLAEQMRRASEKPKQEPETTEPPPSEPAAVPTNNETDTKKTSWDEPIDVYTAILRAVDPDRQLFLKASRKDKTALIVVSDAWHYMPYQVRLQRAQDLWEGWAKTVVVDSPDQARIKVLDVNGNEVGGSRVWGGSLIWVDE